MDKLYRVDDGARELTLRQIMEEMIAQKLRCWRAKQEKITDNNRIAEQIIAMCWGGNDRNLTQTPGCLLQDPQGGYVFVPYDESGDNQSPELKTSTEMLNKALKDKANAGLVRKMDKALEKEVNDKCFWEFIDGGDAARVDFHGKINILAKYRLLQQGIDTSPTTPPHPSFRFGATDITESGAVNMTWRFLPWSCTEADVLSTLSAFSKPTYTPDSALRAQLADLAVVEHPEDGAAEARALAQELMLGARGGGLVQGGEAEWVYLLCGTEEVKVPPAEDREWTPIRQANDVKMVKRLSREQRRWPVMIRPWQLRHCKLCDQIDRLLKRQTAYLMKLEEARARWHAEEVGEAAAGLKYFSQGAISSLDFAWENAPALLGGGGGEGGGGSVNGDGLGAPAEGVVA